MVYFKANLTHYDLKLTVIINNFTLRVHGYVFCISVHCQAIDKYLLVDFNFLGMKR